MVQGYNYIKQLLEATMQEAVDVANHQYRTCQEKDYTVTLTRVLDEKMGDLALRLPGLALNAGLTSSIDAEISVNVVIEELNMTAMEIYDANNKIPGKISTSYKTHAGFTANNKKYEIKCWIEISPVKFQIDPKKVQSGVPFKLNDNGTDTIPFTDGATLPFFRDVPPPLAMKDAEEKKKEMGWGGKAYDFGQKNFNLGVDGSDLYSKWYFKEKGQLRRNKIHKFSELTEKKWNWKWNSAKVFKTTRSWARSGSKIAKRFGPWGLGLSTGLIVHETIHDTWDAHTIVDGILVIVGVGLLIFGGWAVAGTVIAAYGVADYVFDLGGMWDSNVGRESGIWD